MDFEEFKNTFGRPRIQPTQEILDYILEQTARGEQITSICDEYGMPSYATWRKWMEELPEFAKAFYKARKDGAHALVADVKKIADDRSRDIIEIQKVIGQDEQGRDKVIKNMVLNPTAVARDKMRIDARLRLAGYYNREEYGEASEVKHKIEGEVAVRSITRRIVKAEPLQITKIENIDDENNGESPLDEPASNDDP